MSGPRKDAREFRRFVELNAALERTTPSRERRDALASIPGGVEALLAASGGTGDPRALFATLPRMIGDAMRPFGWAWNGFYVLAADGRLHLGPAHGPPVCTPLERAGGLFTSGMCFDCLTLNQTLVAYDVRAWPGYVSCDSESGMRTASGIVCPLRDPEGRPLAVWDLDATQPVEPGDVRFFDVLFATLPHYADPALGLRP